MASGGWGAEPGQLHSSGTNTAGSDVQLVVKLRLGQVSFVLPAVAMSVSACSPSDTKQSTASPQPADTATTSTTPDPTSSTGVSMPATPVLSPSPTITTTTSLALIDGCAGLDPLQVASTFLTAAQDANGAVYRSCVLPPTRIGILDAVVTTNNVAAYATRVGSGRYLLSDQFIRDIHTFPKICCTYSFGSPDLPSNSDPTMHYIDPTGRADITVRTAPDGKYYVVDAFIEAHA